MALKDDLLAGLKAADAAGNAADAQHFADQLKALSTPEVDPITDYSREMLAKSSTKHLNADRALEALQGLTLGWNDESAGVIGGLDAVVRGKDSRYGKTTFGEGYDETTKAMRNRLSSYEKERPLEALGVNALGGLPLVALGGAQLASKAPLGARILTAIRQGVGAGVVAGSGSANGDLSDRIEGAGEGALIGGGLGAAIPLAPAAIKGVARIVSREKASPEQFAASRVFAALANDKVLPSPDKPLIQQGDKSTTALAEQAALTGQGRTTAEEFFDATDKAREGTVLSGIKRIINDKPLYDVMDEKATQRMTDARPLYSEAYQKPYRRTSKLVDLSSRPAIGGAARSAMTRIMNDPDINPEEVKAAMQPIFGNNVADLSDEQLTQRLTQAMGTRPIEFKVLDYIKRGLDAAAEEPTASREIKKLRKAWRDELVNINPTYQAALNAWAGPSAIMDAVNEGRAFHRLDPEAIERLMSGYGDSEREGFQVGVARNLMDQASGAKGNVPGAVKSLGFVKGIEGNSPMQNRLRAALGPNGAPAEKILQRNGWRSSGPNTFTNTTQPGNIIELEPGGHWSLTQTSKSGKSSKLLNAGADQSILESVLTGNPVTKKPGLSSVDELIDMANSMVDTANKRDVIVKGSPTARRLAGNGDFDNLDQIAQGLHHAAGATKKGGLIGLAAHAAQVFGQRIFSGMTDARRAEVAKMLFSTNRDERLRAIQAIDQIRQGKQPTLLYQPGAVPILAGERAGQNQGVSP